jgi:mRNA interferase MazF
MSVEQRDIVLIPFPFSNLKSSKSRPVLVISCDRYNGGGPDFLGMAITSNLSDREHAVLLTQQDLKDGRLKFDSAARADKVYSLSRTLVRRRFGSVNSAAFGRILDELDRVLGKQA